ncbi:MAG: glycosyltransferase family 1 protein [Ignavibacteriae bacterium]|nr:MAG: glycosyltransferase family 1 protein [Ignavibacteriota bacterium]
MKILFDPQVFSFQEFGGISRYYCELIRQFSSFKETDPSLLIGYSNNRYLPEFDSIRIKPFSPSRRFRGRNEIIKALNRKYVRRHFHDFTHIDIFHPTYYDPYFLDLIGTIPFVLTIYDMSHEWYPHMFSPFDFTAKHKRTVSAKAHRIIAISENTKKDIVTLLNIPASKIEVIPLATTLSLTAIEDAHDQLPDKYILYVGKRNTYKNFPFLLNAMKELSQTSPDCYLICAGGGTWTEPERKQIDQLQLSGKIIQRDVNDRTLATLYSKARAFVFPSLYEGFGIPVLEAFACGCPALLSDRSSVREVGGSAALYFDPEYVPSLVERLREILENKTLADDLRTRGLKRMELFSWEQTARKTLEVYRTAAG